MRTTIDLPDPLYRQVKATAAQRGLRLKEFITSALQTALGENSPPPNPQTAQFLDDLRADNTEPVRPLTRDEAHAR